MTTNEPDEALEQETIDDVSPSGPVPSSSEPQGGENASRLDPGFIPCQRFSWAVLAVVVTIPAVGVATTMWLIGAKTFGVRVGLSMAVAALAIFLVGMTLRWPDVQYRHTTYRLHREGLDIWRGVIWRSAISVPRNRVQHTDVQQGPVQRKHGVATLVVHTAGSDHSSVTLEGLRHDVALRVRDALIRGDQRDDERGEGDEDAGR